jgi:hypothetical protein
MSCRLFGVDTECSLMTATRTLASLLITLGCATASTAYATTYNGTPSNYLTLLSGLAPGDTLQLGSGTYTGGLPIGSLSGTQAQPILITGPTDQSAVFTADNCCNTVQFSSATYIRVANLTLDGGHLDGPFGVDSSGTTHDITIENLKIVNYDGSQQTDGISTKAPAWNWIIRHNTIIGAGTGIYLGNSDGSDPFVAGLIEDNVILDCIGYDMEIKYQVARPTGTGLPTGDSRTIVRNNVFAKRSSTVGSDGARPNLLVGAFPPSGAGMNDVYEIYGNFFYQNPTEALFQGEGNVALYDNLFVNSAGDAVNFQYNDGKPRSLSVFHNTLVATGNGIRISGADSNFTQSVIGNASFAGAPLSGGSQQNNVTGTYASASNSLNAPFAAIGSLDLFPKTGQLTGTAVDLTAFGSFDDGLKDFSGNVRTGTHRGAYEADGANSGWTLALSVKPTSGTSTPPPSPAAPTVTLTANALQVASQGNATLNWSTTNATSCSASNGWSGSKSMTGSQTVGPLTSNTTFTLTCSGAGGTGSNSVDVAVTTDPPPSTPSNPTEPMPPVSSPPTGGSGGSSSTPTTPASASGGGGALDLWWLCVLGLSALRYTVGHENKRAARR